MPNELPIVGECVCTKPAPFRGPVPPGPVVVHAVRILHLHVLRRSVLPPSPPTTTPPPPPPAPPSALCIVLHRVTVISPPLALPTTCHYIDPYRLSALDTYLRRWPSTGRGTRGPCLASAWRPGRLRRGTAVALACPPLQSLGPVVGCYHHTIVLQRTPCTTGRRLRWICMSRDCI